jgi:hypothetical protein
VNISSLAPLIATGFSWWTRWRKPILAIAVAWAIGPAGYTITGNAVSSTLLAGFAAGGIMGGNIESAMNGAVTAALFYGVGEISGMHDPSVLDKSFWSDAHIAQTFGHAVVGCFSTSIAGGSCGSGAASAGFAAAAGPLLPGADISPERFVSRMIVGGIGSRLAGDNFANGATSAAFAYLFNELGSLKDRGYPERDRRFYSADDGKVETLGWQNPKDEKEGYGFRIKIRTDADQSLFVYGHVDPSSLAVSQGWRGSKIRTPWIGVLRLRVRFSPALMCL